MIKKGIGIIVLLVMGLAACSRQTHAPAAKSPTTWSRMVKEVIQTQDPARIVDAISGQTMVDTMEGLYRYQGNQLEPALASSVAKPSADGLSYTYHLRQSQWSNGEPVVASDFVYAWRRAVTPATQSENAYLFAGIKNANQIMAKQAAPQTLGVQALDAHTLKVTLAHAVPYFNTMMVNPVFYPLNQKAVERYGKQYGSQARYIVNNGPYTLKGWHGTNNSWYEVKNAHYWNAKAVKIHRINVQVVKDANAALSLFNTGKLDDAQLYGTTAQKERHNKHYQALKQGRTTFLDMNEQQVPAFKNVKLRQALSLAIDRQTFVGKVLGDGSLVAHTLTAEGLAQDPKSGKDFATQAAQPTLDQTTYDLTRAKRLWKEGLRAVGKTQLAVELMSDDTAQAKQSAEYLQAALERLPGFKVTIVSVPFKTRVARSLAGDTQLVISSWQADFPDPLTFLDLYTADNDYNFSRWQNSQYDRLIQQAKTTDAANVEQRYQDLLQAQTLLTQQMAVVPLYQTVEAHLVASRMTKLTYSPANMYNFVGAELR
ncbi:peptide ABC transporter substrate-binding protein [Lacticaseibacillus baoqingensis]|uniref:Peptide ABC transporter substrate-binding protein n=1 Tax=Lacticaseibacillus baoqingensis TaxID=2486013 RepID=A0ABW4E7H8_9LACO|nr:peptide ABC transporter substrate-binding protein [Lacticaseibacillus baoqingensis]